MADKELIRQEIERRIKNLEFSLENNCVEKYSKLDILGNITTLESLLQFIDSLPEEPFDYTNVNIITKDFGELPQTIEQAAVQAHIELEECNGLSFVNTFSKGAEWQKQKGLEDSLKSDMTMPNKFYEKGKADAMIEMKETLQTEYEKGRFDMREEMMKDVVEGEYWIGEIHLDTPIIQGYDDGDKIKFIPIKTEQ